MKPLLGTEDPKFAGAALWAKAIQTTVEQDYAVMASMHYLAPSKERTIAMDTYNVRITVFC